jgi:penicillin-binding protein 1A
MERINAGKETQQFFKPDGTVSASYCLDSGDAPSEACRYDIRGSRVATGTFFKEDIPKSPCTVHTYVDIDTTTNQLATQYCPPENKKSVAMLNLDRRFDIDGIKLNDEKYTVRSFEDPAALNPTSAANPPGQFRVGVNLKEGEVQPNSYCTAHSSAPTPSPSPSDPWDDLFPPDNPDDGTGDTGEQGGTPPGGAATPSPSPTTSSPSNGQGSQSGGSVIGDPASTHNNGE